VETYLWLIFSVGAALCWGLWAFLPKLALRKSTPSAVFVAEAMGACAFAFVVIFFADRCFHPLGALFAFTAGIVGYIGVAVFIKLADDQHIGLAATATSIYPVVTVLLSSAFLQERMTPRQILGVIFAVAAVFLINLPPLRKAGNAPQRPGGGS
jgi:transporter family protein